MLRRSALLGEASWRRISASPAGHGRHVAGALGLLSWTGAPPAGAATSVTVTTDADELNADGDCSLREAVQAVDTATAVDACPAGSNHVLLPIGRFVLLTPLEVTKPIIVTGPRRLAGTTSDMGTSVSGYGNDGILHPQHLFQVRAGGSLTVEKLSLEAAVAEIVRGGSGRGSGDPQRARDDRR